MLRMSEMTKNTISEKDSLTKETEPLGTRKAEIDLEAEAKDLYLRAQRRMKSLGDWTPEYLHRLDLAMRGLDLLFRPYFFSPSLPLQSLYPKHFFIKKGLQFSCNPSCLFLPFWVEIGWKLFIISFQFIDFIYLYGGGAGT